MRIEVEFVSKPEEITLKQYVEYLQLFKEDENYEPKKRDLLRIFSNIKNPKRLKEKDVSRILSIIETALKDLLELKHFKPITKIEGVDFGLIPNLDEISLGEYEDLVDTLQNPKTYSLALEVLYRPITKRKGDIYEIEEYSGNGKIDLSNTPATLFCGAMVFFYNLTSALQRSIGDSLEEKIAKIKTVEKHLEEVRLEKGL